MRLRFVLFAALAAAIAVPAALADPAKVGYPNSMASTGDSITRAFETCSLPLTDCPANSWSTGTSTTVNSHYRRILAANPAISGHAFNDARTGARMTDLNAQVTAAVNQRVDYVTILMGANDVCTSSESTMTPVATLQAQFRTALTTLTTGLPDARVYVVSIPNIYNLWSIWHTNFGAIFVWSVAGICQSMLANPLSSSSADTARRARVAQRNVDDNNAISAVCAQFVHCRFDGGATYRTAFVRSDVSTIDYFHPSVAGQARLAAITWGAGYDFTDQTVPVSSWAVSDGTLTVSATDDRAVGGIELRAPGGAWTRYTGPVALAPGQVVDERAVDVNGNIEASHTIPG
jgi:lysophospholipase L1-like esterase